MAQTVACTKEKYNMTFCILSGIAIIMIVAGHVGYNILSVGDLFPYYSFHVPLFMFISGYFYKDIEEEHPFAYIKKKVKRLLVPYFIWNVLYGVIAWLLHFAGFGMGKISAFGPCLWNLLSVDINLFITMRRGLYRFCLL
ncbi:MAG: acyltransferase family protein [Lachnospiraceae bacterium]|nr:acyltransferase family protein [Lachnospiraceae bacterium]